MGEKIGAVKVKDAERIGKNYLGKYCKGIIMDMKNFYIWKEITFTVLII
jgi:hypothetical protein